MEATPNTIKPRYENTKITVEYHHGKVNDTIEYKSPDRYYPDVIIYITPNEEGAAMNDGRYWRYIDTIQEAKRIAEEVLGKSNSFDYKF